MSMEIREDSNNMVSGRFGNDDVNNDPCPVTALGTHDGVYFFKADRYKKKMTTQELFIYPCIFALFSHNLSWVRRHFPARDVQHLDEHVIEFDVSGLASYLIRECEAAGIYWPQKHDHHAFSRGDATFSRVVRLARDFGDLLSTMESGDEAEKAFKDAFSRGDPILSRAVRLARDFGDLLSIIEGGDEAEKAFNDAFVRWIPLDGGMPPPVGAGRQKPRRRRR